MWFLVKMMWHNCTSAAPHDIFFSVKIVVINEIKMVKMSFIPLFFQKGNKRHSKTHFCLFTLKYENPHGATVCLLYSVILYNIYN